MSFASLPHPFLVLLQARGASSANLLRLLRGVGRAGRSGRGGGRRGIWAGGCAFALVGRRFGNSGASTGRDIGLLCLLRLVPLEGRLPLWEAALGASGQGDLAWQSDYCILSEWLPEALPLSRHFSRSFLPPGGLASKCSMFLPCDAVLFSALAPRVECNP